MKTRHAASIRKGILAARDPELRQYVHLGARLFREAARREAARREAVRIHMRTERARMWADFDSWLEEDA